MVYLDESVNCEILAADPEGFNILALENSPHNRAIQQIPITNGFNFKKKKKMGIRSIRHPGASIPNERFGYLFPTRIPVTRNKITGKSGGNLRGVVFFTYSHLGTVYKILPI